jgi:hypothetical protein
MYILGAVLGQVPFMYLFTRIPMYYLIPFLDIAWGIFTLLQYRVNSYAELAAYRFLVGWFEAAFFPAMHYIFGKLVVRVILRVALTIYKAPGTEVTNMGAELASFTSALLWARSLRP